MIDKIAASVADALAGVQDGATVLIGGFGTAGTPGELIDGLIAQGARDLTLVCNNAGNGDHGIAALIKAGRVRKIICSFPRQADSHVFDAAYRSGQVELELVPQGNLAERMRAAGAFDGGRPKAKQRPRIQPQPQLGARRHGIDIGHAVVDAPARIAPLDQAAQRAGLGA